MFDIVRDLLVLENHLCTETHFRLESLTVGFRSLSLLRAPDQTIYFRVV